MYSLIYTGTAKKQLKKLNRETKERIITVLERCRIRPYAHVARIVGDKSYRLRVGKYRMIIDILDNKLIILVLKIDHRKRVYKN